MTVLPRRHETTFVDTKPLNSSTKTRDLLVQKCHTSHPCHKKTCPRGFQPELIQTNLFSFRIYRNKSPDTKQNRLYINKTLIRHCGCQAGLLNCMHLCLKHDESF